MADNKKNILDVNGDGKVDMKDLQDAASMAGIKDVNDVTNIAKNVGLDKVNIKGVDLKGITDAASGLLGGKKD